MIWSSTARHGVYPTGSATCASGVDGFGVLAGGTVSTEALVVKLRVGECVYIDSNSSISLNNYIHHILKKTYHIYVYIYYIYINTPINIDICIHLHVCLLRFSGVPMHDAHAGYLFQGFTNSPTPGSSFYIRQHKFRYIYIYHSWILDDATNPCNPSLIYWC